MGAKVDLSFRHGSRQGRARATSSIAASLTNSHLTSELTAELPSDASGSRVGTAPGRVGAARTPIRTSNTSNYWQGWQLPEQLPRRPRPSTAASAARLASLETELSGMESPLSFELRASLGLSGSLEANRPASSSQVVRPQFGGGSLGHR
mmetsp:Transcript_57493/g.114120  ORF Transcript_57493/g.114120 Transcript_57493/m.114120 type:complete len:150 (-) Transcript_57493:293-742(-)